MNKIFSLSTAENPLNIKHLNNCYLAHQQDVFQYFHQKNNFIHIDISQSGSLKTLLNFLGITEEKEINFPHFNAGKQVDAWQKLKHPHKINSLSAGKDHKKFFDYA